MQLKLFDIPEETQPHKNSQLTCRNCIHRYKHQYGKMHYCELKSDPRTSYGNKKIKAGDPACNQYENRNKM